MWKEMDSKEKQKLSREAHFYLTNITKNQCPSK